MTSNLLPPPTSVWGPTGWQFLNYVALGYPSNPTEEQKNNYRNFFISLKHILPCKICSNHYKENYEMMPLTNEIMSNKELLVRWVIDLHNVVNVSTGKPAVPYDEAIKLMNVDTKCNKHNDNIISNDNNTMYILLMILGGLVLIAMVYKKR